MEGEKFHFKGRKMLKKLIEYKVIALLSVLILPACYLVGISYYWGHNNVYSVSSYAFPIAVSDAYLQAYVFFTLSLAELISSIINGIIDNVFLIILYSVLLVIGITFLLKLAAKPSFKMPAKAQSILDKLKLIDKELKSAIRAVSLMYMGVTGVMYVFSVLFLIALGLMILPFKKGQESAIKIRDTYIEKSCFFEKGKHWSNCKVLKSKSGKQLIKGVLISQSQTHVAFFTTNGSEVFKIPDGAKIVSEFKSITNNKPTE